MHLKCVARVELYQLGESDTSSSVHVCYSPTDSVLSIKQKLQTLTGIPAVSQTLCQATTLLTDSATLHSLTISCSSIPTLYMYVPIRGGASKPNTGFQAFCFKDVTKEECFEKCSFSSSAPNYRCLSKGINYESKCSNPCCISVRENSYVHVPKGMYPDSRGFVALRSEMFKLVCPACNCEIPLGNCINLLFTACTAEIEWVLADQGCTKGKVTIVTGEGEYKQGKSSVGIIQYHCLDIKLK